MTRSSGCWNVFGCTPPRWANPRKVLADAIAAIRSPDDVLAESVPHLNSLAALLEVIRDHKRFTAAVAQLQGLVTEAADTRAAAEHAVSNLDAMRIAVEPELKLKRQKVDEEIAAAQVAFDQRVREYQKSLSVREATVSDLEKAARADAEAAARLRTELQIKLDAVRAAAA
jgi:hypothetical protein